jgi:hypothetical protein
MFDKSFISSGDDAAGIIKTSKVVVKTFTKMLANVHEKFELSEISPVFYARNFDFLVSAMFN